MAGGLTRRQILALFEEWDKGRYEEIRFRAICYSYANNKGDPDNLFKGEGRPEAAEQARRNTGPVFEFRHPDVYANMPQDEREELTRKMMAHHQSVVGQKKSKEIGE